MRRFIAFGPAFVVLLTVTVVAFVVPTVVRQIGYAGTWADVTLARSVLDGDDVLERMNNAIRSVARAVEPSVVHISVTSRRSQPGMPVGATGSGWIYDDTGHVITNAHVVAGAGRITILFNDGRSLDGTLVGLDASTDVAVLRVGSRQGLIPASRATGVEVRQGDRVFAFGSPFGFKFSMSEGIVSGLGRNPSGVIGPSGYTNYIQTDAAVNPGNSGGPLVDVKGRVVGMNVAIATGRDADGTIPEQGQSAGISFAIPLSTIESVVDQIVETGRVTKGFLGITHQTNEDLNRRQTHALGYDGTGVVVTDVVPGGPAAAAGVRVGDVITHIDGRRTTSITVLRSLITDHRPGQSIAVTVWREGEVREFSIELADLEVSLDAQLQRDSLLSRTATALARYGITMAEPVPGGLFILQVTDGSLADDAGFRSGQTIRFVGGRRVLSRDGLLNALVDERFADGKSVTVTVADTDGMERSLIMELGI